MEWQSISYLEKGIEGFLKRWKVIVLKKGADL